MKTLFSVASCMIVMILVLPEAFGQRGVREDDVDVDVTKFTVLKQKIGNDEYPQIRGLKQSGNQEWGVIVVEYEVEIDNMNRQRRDEGGLYVNELSFEWTVVLSDESKNGRLDEDDVVRLEKTVTYADLRVEDADDRKKTAVIIVDYRTIQRYISDFDEENIFYFLTVKAGRKTVEEAAGHGNDWGRGDDRQRYYPRNGKNDNLFRSEDVTIRRDGLWNRHESPFSYFAEDSLEMIKPDNRLIR